MKHKLASTGGSRKCLSHRSPSSPRSSRSRPCSRPPRKPACASASASASAARHSRTATAAATSKHYHRKRYIARRVKKEKVYVAKRKVVRAEGRQGREGCQAGGRRHGAGRRAGRDRRQRELVDHHGVAGRRTAAVDPETVTPVEVKAETKTVEAKPAVSKPEKAASKLDCKKFFPSVGMTLSVPCE